MAERPSLQVQSPPSSCSERLVLQGFEPVSTLISRIVAVPLDHASPLHHPPVVIQALLFDAAGTLIEPTEPVAAGADLSESEVTLPRRWDMALECFRQGSILKEYLGETYCKTFAALRQGECDDFHYQVSNLDYEWYLRAI